MVWLHPHSSSSKLTLFQTGFSKAWSVELDKYDDLKESTGRHWEYAYSQYKGKENGPAVEDNPMPGENRGRITTRPNLARDWIRGHTKSGPGEAKQEARKEKKV